MASAYFKAPGGQLSLVPISSLTEDEKRNNNFHKNYAKASIEEVSPEFINELFGIAEENADKNVFKTDNFSAIKGTFKNGALERPDDSKMLQGCYARAWYGSGMYVDRGEKYDATNWSYCVDAKFSVGERVEITGGEYGIAGAQAAEIISFGDGNKLVFSDNAIRVPKWYGKKEYTKNLVAGKKYWIRYTTDSGTYAFRYFSPDVSLPKGVIPFFLDGSTSPGSNLYLWDKDLKKQYGPFITMSGGGEANYVNVKKWEEPHQYTVRRAVPKLDLICAHNNRLVGVSNKEKCVWVSALGEPLEFYADPTLASGAWSVAVGSNGDFTGVCSYGGDVLLWKEDRLHKLLGSVPAEFAIYEYQFRGVEKGSERSLVTVDETLFFKSREGVCAYSGGVPRLITDAFGVRRFRNAVAGTDGRRYYISMQDTDSDSDQWGVWVYDPAAGYWLQERRERDLGYTEEDGSLCVLKEDGSLWRMDGDFERVGRWSATFCEMTETYHGRKTYSKLLLRYSLGEGATIRAEISADGGEFKEVAFHKNEGVFGTAVLPISPMRCDKFRIRLSGTGYCRVESLVRKFRIGGEW
jgi:hypothetical protein